MDIKYCYGCQEAKEVILFSKNSSTKDGLNSGCKPCESIRQKIYLNECTEELKEKRRLRRLNWKKNKRLHLRNKYQRLRRKNDPAFKLASNLRSRLNKVIRKNIKTGSAIKDLGCTPTELKAHLESLWEPWMNWDNYGIKPGFWSIGHIIPLSSVDLSDREQFLKVNHYTNLRPLLHELNIKKFNKI